MGDSLQKPVVRSMVLAPDFEELVRGRRFVAEAATIAGFTEIRTFDIIVACSEAAANAIEHAPVKGEVALTTLIYPDRLEVQVTGPGEFQAPHRLKNGRTHRGLGLPLMAQFSDHLALYNSGPGGGTLVTLTFYRQGVRSATKEHTADAPTVSAHVPAPREPEDVSVRAGMPERRVSAWEAAEAKYRYVLEATDLGFCIIDVIFDDEGRAVDWRYLETNPAFARQGGWPDAIGKRVSELVPEVDRAWLDFCGGVALTGVPEKREGVRALGRWYDIHAFKLGGDGDRTVGLLFSNTTERQAAEDALRFVAQVDSVLSGSLAAADIVPLVGEMLGKHLHVDNFLLCEAEEASGKARVLYAWRDERAVRLLQTYLLEELNGPDYWQAMHSGVPFVVNDTRADDRSDAARHVEFGVLAFTIVPFDRDNRWKYLLSVDSATPREWTLAEVNLVKEVANRVVARVERARAEEELRASEESYRLLAEENERLYRQQLDIAEHLQLALLHIPAEIGRVRLGHLYRSATEAARVGGDFYDVFEAKDGTIAILMGDVAGHGIQAARTGTMVKDVVHAFTHQSVRTHEVLRRTNLLLIEKDLPEFVTLFLGIVDPDTGILRYSSAGHPESMIKRVSGEIQLLGCGTSPLGIYPDASWKPHEVELAPGDLLLLYTDGVTEARRDLELFGEKRLERLLRRKRISPGRLPHMILDQVLAFSGGSLNDDLAVLVLSLTEPPEGTVLKPAQAQQKLLDV